jgi:hypothetical protein
MRTSQTKPRRCMAGQKDTVSKCPRIKALAVICVVMGEVHGKDSMIPFQNVLGYRLWLSFVS